MGRRAEWVVLMPVLDVDDAIAIEEERAELDLSGVHPRALDARFRFAISSAAEHEIAEVRAHAFPVKLEIVIAMQDGDRMTGGDERTERGEDVGMAARDATELEACMILCAPEPMLPLLVGELGREDRALVRIDRH